MVDRMSGAKFARKKLFVVCSLLFSVSGHSEDLLDPTRPPVIIEQPVTATTVASLPVGLQSILIGRNRRIAIIDGETVELGGMFQGEKLVAVNETSVVLGSGRGRKVLSLYPDVQRTMCKVEDVSPPGMAKGSSAKPGFQRAISGERKGERK